MDGAWEEMFRKGAKSFPDKTNESVTHLWAKAGGTESVEVGYMNGKAGQSLMIWDKDVSISPSACIHGLGRAMGREGSDFYCCPDLGPEKGVYMYRAHPGRGRSSWKEGR